MTKITIETETIETDLTPAKAAAKIKEALGVREFPKIGDDYWCVGDNEEFATQWDDDDVDRYRLAHGNCSPTQEGLAQYKADEAKKAAIVAIRKHRDKTFGVFEPNWRHNTQTKYLGYLNHANDKWDYMQRFKEQPCGIFVPFRTQADIERSFVECADHWEVLK